MAAELAALQDAVMFKELVAVPCVHTKPFEELMEARAIRSCEPSLLNFGEHAETKRDRARQMLEKKDDISILDILVCILLIL